MKLNCKPGDLAIVIGAVVTPEMIGAIVVCVRRAYEGDKELNGLAPGSAVDKAVWLVESAGGNIPARLSNGDLVYRKKRYIEDRLLRPLRDDPGTDEVLRIAGKPNEVNA